MDVTSYIGREVSVPIDGSRRRRRGYIAEMGDNGQLLVTFYPENGERFDSECESYDPDRVRLLKADVLSGWRAVDVHRADGSPWISLRFRPDVIRTIERYASERGVDFERGFSMLLGEQIDRLDAGLSAA